MAAIIRHFRGSGAGVCRFEIAEKKLFWPQLPHLQRSFAEHKFNRHEKNSGSEHFLDWIRGQSTFSIQARCAGFLTGSHKSGMRA
jgi:hypothetical protein